MVDSIVQAQQYAFKAGIKPDEFWDLTPWELGQWLKAKADKDSDEIDIYNQLIIANAWHTGKYMRYLPQNLGEELRKATGEPVGLSPEASADHMRSYLRAVDKSLN